MGGWPMYNNPFDAMMPTAIELNGLHGIGSKLKKIRKKIHTKVAKVVNKIHDAHDKLPGGKITGKLRDKIKGSKAGQAVISGVAGYFGGPLAAEGVKNVLQASLALKEQERVKIEDRKFLESPEGKEFTANQQKFAALIADMKSTPEYLEIYNKMKADGYSDQQIAMAWEQSKPVKEVAKLAVADTVQPMIYRQALSQNLPPEAARAFANEAALQIGNEAIEKKKAENAGIGPIAIGLLSLLLLGA